jgi:hypothetical protein
MSHKLCRWGSWLYKAFGGGGATCTYQVKICSYNHYISHFTYSFAALHRISQVGGVGQGQGELWCHGTIVVVTDYFLDILLAMFCNLIVLTSEDNTVAELMTDFE